MGVDCKSVRHRNRFNIERRSRSTVICVRSKSYRFVRRIDFSSFGLYLFRLSDGAKVLAIRHGTLDMHGQSTVKTWTRLGLTAANGSSTITLIDPVDWPVNSEIVIATTGDRLSQQECEKRRIMNVSSDGRQLTLNEPLRYTHLGVSQPINGTTIEVRAEVGLLSHTIRIEGRRTLFIDDPSITFTVHSIGANSTSRNSSVEQCPDGYTAGMFLRDLIRRLIEAVGSYL